MNQADTFMPATTKPNKLQRIVSKCYQLPQALHAFALSTVFGRVIKFAGTAGVEVLELQGARSVLPDSKLPLLKQMQIDYIKRSTGDLTAIASLTDDQIATMHNDDKGEITVAVTITDSAGIEPVNASVTWAWIPKKR